MIILLSPAKSLELEKPFPTCKTTLPAFLDEAMQLNQLLKKLKEKDLEQLMDISPKLAALNVERNQLFSLPFDDSNARPSIYTFDGDVYLGLDAFTLSKKAIEFAQQHLRILSGLYGILRPLDLMQAYRLEMGTALKNKKGKDLYAFWGTKITEQINQAMVETKTAYCINLASDEYFHVVKRAFIQGNVINCVFKDKSGAGYKVLSFHAKKARGFMARFIVENKITKPEDMKSFQTEGYLFNKEMSTSTSFVFTRG